MTMDLTKSRMFRSTAVDLLPLGERIVQCHRLYKSYGNWVRVNKSERRAICSESLTWRKIHKN
jgi:hypothetical protein